MHVVWPVFPIGVLFNMFRVHHIGDCFDFLVQWEKLRATLQSYFQMLADRESVNVYDLLKMLYELRVYKYAVF